MIGEIKMSEHKFKSKGGKWLGTIRNWIQWNCLNGSDVIWGSNETLNAPITVKKIEDAAGTVAWSVIKPFYNIRKGLEEIFKIQYENRDITEIKSIVKEMNEEIKLLAEKYNVDLSE